jgi:tetratricopeptide (TPR) repeat protein
LDPDDAWAIAHRGETYRLMGCYAEALADFERAIALEPDQDWYLYDRALTRRALGQVDLAQADLTAAIQVARRTYDHDPRDLPNTFNLALYHLTVAEAEEAERLYREALSGGGSPYHIREAIRELDDFLALVSDYPQARAMRELFQEHLHEPLEDRE